jgi:23S rRNA (guanosine2251-2'-O)-methyltransferase
VTELEEYICGIHAVLSALRHHPDTVEEVMISDGRHDPRAEEVIKTAHQHGVRYHRVPTAKLDRLAGDIRHQGVVARRQLVPNYSEKDLVPLLEPLTQPLLLVLDEIQDPQNLGACLRSAACAGVDAVILPRDRSAPISATVVRTSAGGSEMLSIVRVSNLARSLKILKELGVWLVGADQRAEKPIYELDLTGPLALIVGGEGEGLRRLTREACDFMAAIPIPGRLESLNVSVATGVCLFEALRQRRAQ